jgi:hypothetical protein
LVARHDVVCALGVPRGNAWRFAKKRVLALRVKPCRQLLFSDRHIVFGIHSALTAFGLADRRVQSSKYVSDR